MGVHSYKQRGIIVVMKVNTDINSMKIINHLAEMEQDRYQSSGDYSVTSLINPPRVVRLQKRYSDQIPLDPSSMVAGMTGTAVHEYAEKYLTKWIAKTGYQDYVLEEELKLTVLRRVVSGRYDIRDGLNLWDIKNIKVWKLIFDPEFKEFHEQQNLYAYLLHKDKGVTLKTINILAFYKDWIESSALRDHHYPQSQVCEYELEMWPLARTEEFLMDRLQLHIDAEDTPDNELPVCTREERWERHQGGSTVQYAIMKNPKAKRATRVLKTGDLDDALDMANGMKGMTRDSFIEVRYAKPKRCVNYCNIKEHCSFWKHWDKRGGNLDEQIKFKV